MFATSLSQRTDGRPTNKGHSIVNGHCLASTIFTLLIVWFTGCATSPRQLDHAKVEIDERGVVRVADKPIMLEDLPDRLKEVGATPETRITIILPQDRQRSLILEISKQLTAAGYFRYKFKSPWKTSTKVPSMGQ